MTGPALQQIGLDACSLTAGPHEGLCEAGLAAICTETRRANAAMKTMSAQTDRNNAQALAQVMRAGWFRPVRVRSGPCRLFRSALVALRTILNGCARSRTSCGRSPGVSRNGITLGTPSQANFAANAREMADCDHIATASVEPLPSALATRLAEFTRMTFADREDKRATCEGRGRNRRRIGMTSATPISEGFQLDQTGAGEAVSHVLSHMD